MEVGLPVGWQEYFDESHGCPYYYNPSTGVTQWQRPQIFESNKSPEKDMPESTDANYYSDVDDDEDFVPGYRTSQPSKDNSKNMAPSTSIPLEMSATQPSEVNSTNIVGGKSVDYINVAKSYKEQRPYCDRRSTIICVLCQNKESRHVFFPCEHRCLCPDCITSGKFVPERYMSTMPGGYCICPVCAGIIKLILPFEGGAEVEKYWRWVLEVKPPIPPDFMGNFKHSAGVIQKVYIDDRQSGKSQLSSFCLIS